MISKLRMRFQRRLLVHSCSSAETSHAIDAEGAYQNDPRRIAIPDGLQQISGSHDGIEKEICSSSLFSGGQMENQLHAINGLRGVLSILQVPNTILNTNPRILLCQLIELANIRALTNVAADIGVAASQEPLDHSL